ncbi:MAG: hypothetical protein H6772_02380 [Pseudomonadales bacterium]|nr:hypothetical protein [Pseudomonadales bacterium]
MSVEGYRPERIPTRRIEGSEISTFREITIDETDPVDLFDISWPNYNAGIKFKKVGSYSKKRYGVEERYPLYEAIAIFKDLKNKVHEINLTKTTSRKRCLFTGSNSGFFMHDPAWVGIDSDYYVVGINPRELQADIRRQIATYHELGHAEIVDHGYDTQLLKGSTTMKDKDLPAISMIKAYAKKVKDALIGARYDIEKIKNITITPQILFALMNDDTEIDSSIRLFHERNAWAGGDKLIRKHKFPIGFEKKSSLREYSQFCLETYARYYSEAKFTKGMRDRKNRF